MPKQYITECYSDATWPVNRAGSRQGRANGANVILLVPKDCGPLLFKRRVKSAWVVSDVQFYLDLMAWPRRGKEQARHLRETRMAY